MTTEAQLLEALRRADAASDAPAAQAIARRIQEMRTESYVRPEVDPATDNMDPRDVQASRRTPAASFAGKLREVYEVGPLAGMLRGARDPIDAGAQLLVRGARTAGLADDAEVQRVDRGIRQADDAYLYATGRKRGELDVPRAAGSVALTTAAMPARLLRGATVAQRAGSAAAVGAAGGALQPVIEGDFGTQKAAQVGLGALTGAIAAPVLEGATRAVAPAVNAIARAVKSRTGALTRKQADNLIAQSLQREGIEWGRVADDVKAALRTDVDSALRTGGKLNDRELARLADLRAVGATPTRGAVTLDPVQVTAERNLAKTGANSTDPQVQRMARLEAENNQALIDRLNTLRGPSTSDEFATGAQLIGALKARDEQAAGTVRGLYDRARQMAGGEISLDGPGFVNQASRTLDAEMRGAFLPAEVRGILQRVASGEVPLNISTAEQLRTMLATAQRSSQDGNARRALSIVRDALENAQPTQGGQAAGEVTAAFRRARTAHAARMRMREESPALDAALDDAQPDRFVQKFVVGQGASTKDVNALRRAVSGNPEALESTRSQIVNHLKTKALSGSSEEGAAFSQSAYNRALDAIGDRKLSAFFSPDEIANLRQLGRAARYLQVQPKGSAVNNSNTASALTGMLDRVISRVPFGDAAIRAPINNLMTQRQASQALNVLPANSFDLIDDAMLARLAQAGVPLGGALGVAAAQ